MQLISKNDNSHHICSQQASSDKRSYCSLSCSILANIFLISYILQFTCLKVCEMSSKYEKLEIFCILHSAPRNQNYLKHKNLDSFLKYVSKQFIFTCFSIIYIGWCYWRGLAGLRHFLCLHMLRNARFWGIGTITVCVK